MGRKLNIEGFSIQRRPAPHAGVFNYDVQAGVTRGCKQIATFFGVPEEACAKGLPAGQLIAAIHPDDRDRVTRSIERTMKTGGVYMERYRTVNAEHGNLTVRATGFCFHDENDHPASFVGSIEPEANNDGPYSNADRTEVEHVLTAYHLTDSSEKPLRKYLLALVLEDMGVTLTPMPVS